MSYSRTTETNKSGTLFLILIVLFTVLNFGIMCKNWSDYSLSKRVEQSEQFKQAQMQFNQKVQADLQLLGSKVLPPNPNQGK